jgi:integrase
MHEDRRAHRERLAVWEPTNESGGGRTPPRPPSPRSRDPKGPGGTAICFMYRNCFELDDDDELDPLELPPSLAPRRDAWRTASGVGGDEHDSEVASMHEEMRAFAGAHARQERTQHPAGGEAAGSRMEASRKPRLNEHYAGQCRNAASEWQIHDVSDAIAQLQSIEAVRVFESMRTAACLHGTLDVLLRHAAPSGSSSQHAARGAINLQAAAQVHLQQRAAQMAASLKADTSRWALHGASEEQLADACSALTQILDEGKPKSAHGNENSAWRHWLSFCVTFNTDPWRNNPASLSAEGRERETVTLALAFTHIYERMSNRPGRKFPPKPQSALQVLRTVRRMHARLGIEMVPLTLVTRLVHALNRRYVARYGIDSLQPQRVEPLTNTLIQSIMSEEMNGVRVGSETVDWSSRRWKSVRSLWATLAQTGFRRDEVSLAAGETLNGSKMSRASVRYRIGGVDRATTPSAAELKKMKAGDFVLLIPATCKTDQVGLEWGQKPIWLPFSATAAVCAARELRDIELAWPVADGEQRARTPLFTDGAGRALVSSKLNELLRNMLVASGQVSRERAQVYTLHSFRRYLACALLASKADSFTIMALLRWKTDESLKVYADFNPSTYGGWLTAAGGADISSIRTRNLPRTDFLDLATTQERYDHQLQQAAERANATAPADDEVDHRIEDCSDDEADDEREQPAPRPPQLPATRAGGGARRRGSELLHREPEPKRTRTAAQPKPSKVRVGRRSYEVSQDDRRGLVGCDVDMPNEAWGGRYADGGSTQTRVLHHAPLASGDGSDAYICEAEGVKYLFRASDVEAASTASA